MTSAEQECLTGLTAPQGVKPCYKAEDGALGCLCLPEIVSASVIKNKHQRTAWAYIHRRAGPGVVGGG